MDGIPPLPKCENCDKVLHPEDYFAFVSCGHLLCSPCARLTEGRCPKPDNGVSFEPSFEMCKILTEILRDIHRVHSETQSRLGQLQTMSAQLKSILNGAEPVDAAVVATCPNCSAAMAGGACQFCRYREACEVCGQAMDLGSQRCLRCEQEMETECRCPVCGVQVTAEDMFDGHKAAHLRYITQHRKDSSIQKPNIRRLHPLYHEIEPELEGAVLHSKLGGQLEDLLMHHRDFVEKKICEVDPILSALESELQEIYRCKLAKYGSGANGFTMVSSDFDVTVLIENVDAIFKFPASLRRIRAEKEAELKKFTSQVILNDIAKVFVRNGFTLEDRLSARTPILKCVRLHLELDISVGNEVAVYNSDLLNTYALLDERVRALGIAIKHWSKSRCIADASQGYLSSYSYLILLIAYLQRTSPPLIPNLQEDFPRGKARVMVEDFDCSFEKDTTRYDAMCRNNESSLDSLLVGFFKYYGFTFDWQTNCVTIRKLGVMLKTEKRWENSQIAIEDPFEVRRNLGDVSVTQVVRNVEDIKNEFKYACRNLVHGYDFIQMCSYDDPAG